MNFRYLGRAPLYGLLVLLLFARCKGIQPDELDCEEAVAYLEKCCPTFHGTEGLQCVDTNGGCSGTVPDITTQQSECIRSRSCDDLVSSGVCTAASTPAYEQGTNGEADGGTINNPNPDICQ